MSEVRKRSVRIAGHRSSVSLEPEFWEALKSLAASRAISVEKLIGEVDGARSGRNLSSALRLHVLAELRRTARL